MSLPRRQLTYRQREVYEFIVGYVDGNGYGPTIREIMDGIDIKTPNGVMCHLDALEAKNWIRRDTNVARGIRVIEDADKAPLLAKIRQFDVDTLRQIVRRYGPP